MWKASAGCGPWENANLPCHCHSAVLDCHQPQIPVICWTPGYNLHHMWGLTAPPGISFRWAHDGLLVELCYWSNLHLLLVESGGGHRAKAPAWLFSSKQIKNQESDPAIFRDYFYSFYFLSESHYSGNWHFLNIAILLLSILFPRAQRSLFAWQQLLQGWLDWVWIAQNHFISGLHS